MEKDQLKEVRKVLGFSQAKLAEILGTFQQTVARWESGTRSVPDDFAFVLGLHAPLPSIGYLIEHPEAFTPEMDMARCVAEIRYYREREGEAERSLSTLAGQDPKETEHARRIWDDARKQAQGYAAHAAFRLVDLMTEKALRNRSRHVALGDRA